MKLYDIREVPAGVGGMGGVVAGANSPFHRDGLPKVCRQQNSKCSACFEHFSREIEKGGCSV